MTHLSTCRCCCCRLCRCWAQSCFALSVLMIVLTMALPGSAVAQRRHRSDVVKFQLRDRYLIIVKVTVNSFGPYDFLLDTGTSRSVIDPWLAHHVRMPIVGAANVTASTGEHRASVMQLDEIRVSRAMFPDPRVIVDSMEFVKQLAPSIHGILGEDLLSEYDLLIDYKQRTVSFGGDAPDGERFYFATGGMFKGGQTANRILLPVEIAEVSGSFVPLQLDTGAYLPEIFASKLKDIGTLPWSSTVGVGQSSRVSHTNVTLKIGSTTIKDLEMVQDRRNAAFDSAGLLPASLFRRIFISHSGGYIVLNPAESPQPEWDEVALSIPGQ